MINTIYNYYTQHDFYTSLLIIISSISLYTFIKFIIKKQDDWPNLKKRHHISFSRNLIIIVSFLLLFFTWRGEIKSFVFSISAITAGLIVVFKEVILSFFSYFIVSSNNLFKIGDVLEFDDKVGRVIDRSLIYTKISLVGPNEGKDLMIPNILFVTTKFINLTSAQKQTKVIHINATVKNISKKQEFIEDYFKEKNISYRLFIDYQSKDEVIFKYNIELTSLQDREFSEIKNELILKFLERFKI